MGEGLKRARAAALATRNRREPLPDGAWDEALKWWSAVTARPDLIASYKLEIRYTDGVTATFENSPRTRRQNAKG